MNEALDKPLSAKQLEALKVVFHIGAGDASIALEKWLKLPSVITVDSVDQVPLQEATEVLGEGSDPVCFCSMGMSGIVNGQLIFVFGEKSGLALADLILGRPPENRTSENRSDDEWGEVESSAALETANIIGCAYLNSLQKHLPAHDSAQDLLPSPPVFRREYVESLLQFALMSQIMESDVVFLTETQFHVDQTHMDWTLLFVPDGPSMETLRHILPE
jgi:chemotaxis protein CheC